MRRLSAALLALVTGLHAARAADPRDVLAGLIGRTKAELVQRLGPPSDSVTTVDGERLFFDRLDAGRVDEQSGQETRAGGPADVGLFPRVYAFRCRTEVVLRDGRVQAFNRSGNGCR